MFKRQAADRWSSCWTQMSLDMAEIWSEMASNPGAEAIYQRDETGETRICKVAAFLCQICAQNTGHKTFKRLTFRQDSH
jgi:hypothetical protein